MDEYFIGAGALLTAGPAATIASATLHAQLEPGLAGSVEAALIDFEAAQASEVRRVLIVARGWSGSRFRCDVVQALLRRQECTIADVIATLAEATGVRQIHLFAHWRPDDATANILARRGLEVRPHPLGAIGQAALVSGQRMARWPSPVRAA